MAEITDLDANKPVGSGAGAEGVDSADNWLRLIQNVLKTVTPRWLHVEDFSPKPKLGSQDARSTEIASPRDKNPYINPSKGAVQLRLPAAGYVYDTGTATTTLGSATVTGGSSLEKWLTNAQPGMPWISNAGNAYIIKSIESEVSMTLATEIAAADVQTAAAYSIRLLYDAGRWPAILPLFAVRRPDGTAGPINANGGLNPQYTPIWRKDILRYDESDVAVSALTMTRTLFALPAAGVVHHMFVVIEEQFVSGTITDLKMELGDATDPDGFIETSSSSDLLSELANALIGQGDHKEIGPYFQVGGLDPGDMDGQLNPYIPSITAATNLLLKLTATGANLDTLTAGRLAVYTQYSQLPTTQVVP